MASAASPSFAKTHRPAAQPVQAEQKSSCIRMDDKFKGTNTCNTSVTVIYCTVTTDNSEITSCADRKHGAGETVIFPSGTTIQGRIKDTYSFGEPSTTAVLWAECAETDKGMQNSPRGPIGKCAGESKPAHVFDSRTSAGPVAAPVATAAASAHEISTPQNSSGENSSVQGGIRGTVQNAMNCIVLDRVSFTNHPNDFHHTIARNTCNYDVDITFDPQPVYNNTLQASKILKAGSTTDLIQTKPGFAYFACPVNVPGTTVATVYAFNANGHDQGAMAGDGNLCRVLGG